MRECRLGEFGEKVFGIMKRVRKLARSWWANLGGFQECFWGVLKAFWAFLGVLRRFYLFMKFFVFSLNLSSKFDSQ